MLQPACIKLLCYTCIFTVLPSTLSFNGSLSSAFISEFLLMLLLTHAKPVRCFNVLDDGLSYHTPTDYQFRLCATPFKEHVFYFYCVWIIIPHPTDLNFPVSFRSGDNQSRVHHALAKEHPFWFVFVLLSSRRQFYPNVGIRGRNRRYGRNGSGEDDQA